MTMKKSSTITPTLRKPTGGNAPGTGKAKTQTPPADEPMNRQTDLNHPMDEELLDNLFDDEERR